MWMLLLMAGLARGDGSSEITSAESPADVARKIDATLQREMDKDGTFRPAPLVDDYTYLRRVVLDTIGRPPTAAEIQKFVADTRREKRSTVVEGLL
ncbi:MAG TPA: DUF1549 domain-containing protein, partial [Pirellulaceae bacterium]